MPGMRDIKRRIRSVKNTQQITRAMKMVSAAKLRKNQDRLVQYRPFSESHQHMLERVLAADEEKNHTLLKDQAEGKPLYLLMTSDKGLCGSFNQNIIRKVENELKEIGKENVLLYPVGKKGYEYFKKRGYNIWKYEPMSFKGDVYEFAQTLGQEVIDAFYQGEFSSVRIAYAQFKSALSQTALIENMIPLSLEVTEKEAVVTQEFNQDYLFEPSAAEVLSVLLPMSIKLKAYRSILETNTSEHGARMTAMDSATNNASDMIASLTLNYNKARQAAITRELIEVVGGADALT